ncbi:uncharacterized protein [Lepeophtheirus salmonis]|uniref:Uncharacterized protein n=1 Tax=Lepeophtheirus salmonis TaxID=72036 RepID=A0A0K2T6S8_LEPSM|nr:uncharacterized protein LOC121121765 [Lepeophtheirus salmonis]
MLSYWISFAIVLITALQSLVINCQPIKLSDIRVEESKFLIQELEEVKDIVKYEAFKAFSSEVAARGITLERTKSIIDVVKFFMEETIKEIDEIISNLNEFQRNPDSFDADAENYVNSVIEMLPEIVPFVIDGYRDILLRLKQSEYTSNVV